MVFGRPEIVMQSQIEKIRVCQPVKADKLETIVEFSTAIQNLCATLEATNLFEYDYNPLFMIELVDKLPPNLKLEWAKHSENLNKPGITSFGEWLQEVANYVLRVLPIKMFTNNKLDQDKKPDQFKRKMGHLNVHVQENRSNSLSCIVCKGICSKVVECKQFVDMKAFQRWKMVKQLKLCKYCLEHKWGNPKICPQPKNCNKENCKLNHHPLLHDDTYQSNNFVPVVTQNSHLINKRGVMFQYVPVILRHKNKQISTLAFIDSGSDGTFLEDEIAKKLELDGPQSNLCIKWTGTTSRSEPESMNVSFKIAGILSNAKEFSISSVRTVKSLNLPEQTLNYNQLCDKFPHIKNLPIQSYASAKPTMLIGLNNWKLGVCLRIKEGEASEPIAMKSRLGWTLCANVDQIASSIEQFNNYHMTDVVRNNANDKLDVMMKQYFSLESIGVMPPQDSIASQEERRATELMKSKTKLKNGRFETCLLWKHDYKQIPESREMALQRLKSTEQRLNKNEVLKNAMQNHMKEYAGKDYIRKLSTEELNQHYERIWYLPMFPVVNPNKPSKVRPVWDAAAKSNGVSLNSLLLKGPDQMSSLIGVLLRFRQKQVAVTGDIAEMFHRIKINEEDQHAQRFLWRDCDESKNPDTYVMQVMTFGATCSPSLAQYVKNLNAARFKNIHPDAYSAIVNDHYVDDLLVSVDSEAECLELVKEIKKIHAEGGFHIRNWKSNSIKLMEAMEQKSDETNVNLNICAGTDKVLGMWWNMEMDCFTYSLKFNKGNKDVLHGQRIPTKREILQILMSLYDPLGLLAHYTTWLKVILQDVWRIKTDWDEEINESQSNEWFRWVRNLEKVEDLQIQRCYLKSLNQYNDAEVQIHIFVDASKNASAAVAYLRVICNNTIECRLVGAKTRVAPIKLMTIPKLELTAALIGARFGNTLIEQLSIKINKMFYWTDAKTILSWLQADAKNIKGQFIAFRVAEIQDTTDVRNWRYIPSAENVADDATKWVKVPQLSHIDRWFTGPQFLWKSEINWPDDIQNADIPECHEEVEEISISTHQIVQSIIKYEKFSDWTKLVRAVATILRYFSILKLRIMRSKANDLTNQIIIPQGILTSDELQKSKYTLYKLSQSESFPEDVITLLKNKNEVHATVGKKSQIYNYSPYLDENEVLRVKGRIDAAVYLSFDTKRPIILDRNHHITKLIVMKYHQIYYHANNETVINEVRQCYAIGKLRQMIKSIRKECSKCKILDAKPNIPEMAPLPAARLAAFTRPFTYVGVDYFGPIKIVIGRRNEKRWGCLFTCLTIRAVHVELAYSLSTDSFILCYRNFINRRGQPRKIFSDCGTNFVGAEKELRTDLKQINHQRIAEKFTSSDTTFVFNPPASPHMGGAWERMVKSVKISLYAAMPNRTPSEELLRCFLIEVENIINSRPLTYLPLDSEESEALTPNHFLLGSSSGVKPIGNFSDDAKLLKSNWLMVQLYSRRFWQRWVKEYVTTLTRRTKWCSPVHPIRLDDIVIIVDENQSQREWVKGRVIEVYQGKDGQVRSAKVQTASGVYHRPVVKLAKLDLNDKQVVN